jgi:hypothetical protein
MRDDRRVRPHRRHRSRPGLIKGFEYEEENEDDD